MKIKNRLGDADADRTEVYQIKSSQQRLILIFEEYK
ncbi:hypothetical protein SSUST1_0710 [Streptococcus suis ST1]|nr:hypothetical protein SSUST1_0710 [Streptococcus suis ST1]